MLKLKTEVYVVRDNKKISFVEFKENINGKRIVILFQIMGHRCGYVGVGKNHKLYGLNYDKLEDLFDVHGDVTFAGKLFEEKEDYWYIGFDCAHCFDRRDFDKLREYGLYNKDLHSYAENIFRESTATIKTEEYVLKECILLSKQIDEVII